jgi:hypothetical protein
MAHLAGALQLGERAHRFGERHVRIGRVELVQVDAFEAQPP